MAVKTPESREEQDQAYNPYENPDKNPFSNDPKAWRDLYRRSPDGDDTAKDLKKQEERAGAASGGTDNKKSIQDQEAGWDTNVTPQAPQSKGGMAARLKGFKKKGSLTAIIVGVVLGLVLGGGFFGATLAPFMFLSNTHLDLSDITSVNQKRSTEQVAEAFGYKKTATEKIGLGCSSIGSKLPIKCKLKSVSPWLEDKLRGVGIEIEGTKKFGGRVVPQTYKFKGVTYNAEQFAVAIKGGNTELWAAYNRALNSNWLAYKGKTFVKGVLAKFGLSQKPAELSGDRDEMAKQFMNGEEAGGGVNEANLIQQKDDKGNLIEEWEDEAGNKYNASEREKLISAKPTEAISANNRPMSQMAVGTLEKVGLGLNILGWADAACTVRNLIGNASVSAKVSNAGQLAAYAMPRLASISKLQAGDVLDPQEAQIIQEYFMMTDARKTVAGFVEEGSTIENGAKAGEVPNPNYGKNAMDSPLYQASVDGKVGGLSDIERTYSLGYGAESLFASIASGVLGGLNFASTVKNQDGCGLIQNGVVRFIGIGFGVAIAIAGAISSPTGVGVGVLAAQSAKAAATIVAFTAATMLLTRAINAAFTTSLITDAMEHAPIDRGAALWTGMAVLLGTNAQMRGMMPGNAEEIVAYQKEQNIAEQQYIALQRRDSKPLDVRDPYSLVGTVSFAISSHMPNSASASSLAAIPTSISSLVKSGFSSLLTPYSAHAATIDPERFKLCDDEGYRAIGIDADMQCNVRYVMPNESMQWSPLEAAQLMEDGGFVKVDTETGYPDGYTPPDPAKLQKGAMDMIKGVAKDYVKGIINSVYNTDNYEDKYNKPQNPNGAKFAKFLDYCVYRAMPYGKTYEESGAIKAVGEEWLDGRKCRDRSDNDINLFRIYVFDKSVNDDLDGPIVDPYCAPSLVAAGSSVGKATAAQIDKAIENAEKSNNTTSKLHGKGAEIIKLSNLYGVNSDFVAVTLAIENQFGADGSAGPTVNNFGYNKLNDDSECDPININGDPYNCYLTPEAGIEGVLKNLTKNPDYKTKVNSTAMEGAKPGTVAAVRDVYCPEGDPPGVAYDHQCHIKIFLDLSKTIGIPLEPGDPVFSGSSSAPASSSTTGSSGGLSSGGSTAGGGAASVGSAAGGGAKMSESELKSTMTSYGLPEPQASGEAGYEALAKKLKDNPDALWAAQSLLAGEKNAKSKGIELKEYLTTAWIWFEGDKSWGPEPYEMNCLNDTEGTEAAYVCPSDQSGDLQVAGYQASDVRGKFKEIYNKLYTDDELVPIMKKVVENSTKASKDIWDYNDSSNSANMALIGNIDDVTMADIWPDQPFLSPKHHIINLILGKDPTMAVALNSFAVSDGDVVAMLKDCTSLGWSNNEYYCNPALRQEIANMMMALYVVDDGKISSSSVGCAAAAGAAMGTALAGWTITTDPDTPMKYRPPGDKEEPAMRLKHAMLDNGSTDFIVSQLHGPGNSQFAIDEKDSTYKGYDFPSYGFDSVGHPGYDIAMPLGTKLYAGVTGTVVTSGASHYFYNTEKTRDTAGMGELKIQLSNGDELIMGHMQKIVVNVGDPVTPGTYVGESGYPAGAHLHLEYREKSSKCTSGYCIVDPTFKIP